MAGFREFWESGARAARAMNDFYTGPYRRTLNRARQEEDDLFLLLVLADAMGVPNPMTYETLELLPVVYDRFHDWHRRMGMERSPLDNLSCC